MITAALEIVNGGIPLTTKIEKLFLLKISGLEVHRTLSDIGQCLGTCGSMLIAVPMAIIHKAASIRRCVDVYYAIIPSL